ncbi:MAG: tetratricopeptide repeat protein [Taibaiella sp.]|nr:tetratricopeptide repeat protein [Taibaiella sp.]
MSTVDTLDILFENAKGGSDQAVDDFFCEVLELISLAQGMGVDPIIEKAMWFCNNPDVTMRGLAYAMFISGFVDSFYAKHSSSIDICSEAHSLFAGLGFADGVAMCALVKGTNYRSLGNIDLAIQYMKEAYDQLHKTDNILHFTIAGGHQLADLYIESGNYAESLALCQEVWPLTLLPANKRKVFDARLLNTIGNVYAKLGNNVLALQYLRNALSVSESLRQLPVTARTLTDLGRYYLSINDYDTALAHNNQALELRAGLQLRNPMITNLINIASIYELQGKPDAAIATLLKGFAIADELKVNIKLLQILKKLSGLYESKDDLRVSLDYYKRYNTLLEEQINELHDQKITNVKLFAEAERAQKEEIAKEKKRSDDLLLNILPEEVAEELKNSDAAEARYFSDVTVLFTDFVDFTATASRFTPKQLVSELHACFKAFDEIMEQYEIEKIKTVGDAYLAVCGLPVADTRHAENVVLAAIDICNFMKKRHEELGEDTFKIRVGINSGSVVAGIVGVKKFSYDIWGDTVNTAARMEQNSEAGSINISQSTYELVKDKFACKCRGEVHAKGKGMLRMYYVGERLSID